MASSQKLIAKMVKFRQYSFIQILQQTMITLFPIALIGASASVISHVFLSPSGFLGSVLHIRQWFPQYQFFRELFNDLSVVTVGWISPYAALLSAHWTTHRYHRNIPVAGLAALASYVLIFFHSVRGNQNVLEMRYYNANWLIIGIGLGYIVGRFFVKYSRPTLQERHSKDFFDSIFANIKPLVVVFSITFILHLGYALLRTFGLDMSTAQSLTSLFDRHSTYLTTILISLLSTILTWLGFAESINISNSMFSSELFANLNYALTHKTNWHVPYPFTPVALYNGFAQFGGVGVGLAFLIAILWVSHHRNKRLVAQTSALPVLFNTNLPLTVGTLLILNPLYLIPFVLLPIINMLLASGLILLHAIPPLVYPIPSGTPGILVPLVGTGGNWLAFVFSILLLVVDVIVYLPFVKLAEDVEDALEEGQTNEKE